MNILKITAAAAVALGLASSFTMAHDTTAAGDTSKKICPDKGKVALKDMTPECVKQMDQSNKPAEPGEPTGSITAPGATTPGTTTNNGNTTNN